MRVERTVQIILVMDFAKKLSKDKSGATAIEYGLIVAFMAIGVIAALQSMSNSLNTTFNTTSSAMSGGNAA